MERPEPTHGVVFVHGIGSQHESDFLLDVATPLLTWLTRWSDARHEQPPELIRSSLRFAATNDAPPALRSHATLRFPSGECWAMNEAWWATDFRRQGFGSMLAWCWKHVRRIADRLGQSFMQRWTGHERDAASVAPFWRKVLAIYTAATALLYRIAAFLGLPFVFLLLLLIQIPIPTVQAFLLRMLQPFIEINLSEFRAICEDELQAANMRRVVAEMVLDLAAAGCPAVTIIAHSAGAAISFDMLADPAHGDAASYVTKFITVGEGLNKAWLLAPTLPRLQRPLPEHIHWVDLWATFDPVPAGWLSPPKVEGVHATIFAPEQAVIDAQGLTPRSDPSPFPLSSTVTATPARYWPVSVKVTNGLSILADHGLYWQNDEEVIARFAAEIDATYYRDSRFWKGYSVVTYSLDDRREIVPYDGCAETTICARVRSWRERVIRLALFKSLFILAWPFVVALLARPLADWLRAHGSLFPIPDWFVAIAHAWHFVSLLAFIAAALLLGFAIYLVFTQVVQKIWQARIDHWQERAVVDVATARDLVVTDPPAQPDLAAG